MAGPFCRALSGRSLDPAAYEVLFACHPRYNALLGDLPFAFRPIESVGCDRFLDALARGAPLYDADTLEEYVREDLEVLREFRPDVVVGDFRLSLSVSARLAGVRYLTVTNAYWSPFARQRFPMPDLPFVRTLGVSLASVVLLLGLRPMVVDDQFRLIEPNGSTLSPNGKWVFFTLRSSSLTDNKTRDAIWIASADGTTAPALRRAA